MRKVFCEVLGKELELPEKVENIISLSPAATEALYFMELGHLVNGVSVYCVHPEEARKKKIVGAYRNIKEKVVEEISPELIITTTGYQRDFAIELSEKYPVYALPLPPTVSAIISFSAELGIVCGFPEKASEIQKKLIKELNKFQEVKNNKKVYIEIDLGGPVSFGKYSYIIDACRILGINTIFSNENVEWLSPTTEQLLELNPDIIIYEPKMFSKRNRTIEEVKNYFISRGLGELKAIKEENILITPSNYDFLAHHGPSFITKAMQWLYDNLK